MPVLMADLVRWHLPGDALGVQDWAELKFQALLTRARQALGARFNIRDFHAEILKDGAMPMDILEAKMKLWMEARRCMLRRSKQRQAAIFIEHVRQCPESDYPVRYLLLVRIPLVRLPRRAAADLAQESAQHGDIDIAVTLDAGEQSGSASACGQNPCAPRGCLVADHQLSGSFADDSRPHVL